MAEGKVIFEVMMTSKGAKQLSKQLGDTKKETKKVNEERTKLGKTTDNTNKKEKSLYQTNLSSAKGFSKMKETMGSGSSGLVGAYATLAANVFAATAAFNALKQAAQVQTMIDSLDVLGSRSGQNLEALSMRIRGVSGGAIDMAQAMQTASVGASAGFDPSQMEKLTQVAKSAALALGRDVGDAIDRVTRGAAKLEPEILDELGLFVRVDDAAAKYAATLGKSASELNRFEKRMAFANEIAEQGERKFGALFDMDASNFDELGATLMDLGRKIMDAFNMILGPIAGFFAKNEMALMGFMMVITKGVLNQAIPILSRFGIIAANNAQKALDNARREEEANKKVIRSYEQKINTIKGMGKGYNDLAKNIQKGEYETKDLETASKKLNDYILGAQKRIKAGTVKQIALVKERIALAKQELSDIQALNAARQQGTTLSMGAGSLGKTAQLGRVESKIFTNLEKDPSFKGHMKAMKRARWAGKAHMADQKRIAFGNKTMATSFMWLKKPMFMAKMSFRSFGITARVAIKGIFTAIPVIGQLLFLLDLLISALVGAFRWLGNFRGEASALSKAMEQTDSMINKLSESQGRNARENQSAADALMSSATANAALSKSLEELQQETEKARAELNVFGRMFDDMGNWVQKWLSITKSAFIQLGLSIRATFTDIQIWWTKWLISMAKKANTILPKKYEFKMEGTDSLMGDLEELERKSAGIQDEMRFTMTAETQSKFDASFMDAGLVEVKAFQEMLKQAGEGSQELRRNLTSGFDINEFFTTIHEGSSVQGYFSDTMWKTIEATEGLIDSTGKVIDVQDFLQMIMQKGVANTTAQGQALTILTETLREAKQQMSEFNQKFTKKGKISSYLATLKVISEEMAGVMNDDASEMGSGGLVQMLNEAEPTFVRMLMHNENLRTKMEEYNKRVEAAKDANGEVTEETKAQIANELELGGLIKNRTAQVAKLAKEIHKGQLFSAAEISTQNRIMAGAAKWNKMNTDAEELRIKSSNSAIKISADLQEKELQFQKETSGLYKENGTLRKSIADMTEDELGAYASILDNEEKLAKTKEKSIGAAEKQALLDKQTLAFNKLKLQEEKKSFALVQARIKAEQQLASAGKGRGLKQTPAEILKQEKIAAAKKIAFAETELALLQEKLRIELIIMDARMNALDIDSRTIFYIKQNMKNASKLAEDTAKANIEKLKAQEKLVGLSKTLLINEELQGEKMLINAAKLKEQFQDDKGNWKKDIGFDQEGFAAMTDFLSPMRESLKELGPEGELIAMAQEGMFTLATAFLNTMEVFNDKGASFGDKLVAGAQMAMQAIGVISQLQQQNTKAQVAEIDKQIEAEKKRDGQSAASVGKIKAMEKKKEAIQRKAFETKKSMDIAQAVISTALGATRAYEIPVVGPALAAMVLAMGMKQISLIKAQQFTGSAGNVSAAPSTIEVGKRNTSVDTAQGATAGELAFLRGQKGQGSNANNFIPGGAAGMRRGYAAGGEILVGERGPEVVKPTTAGYEVVPNDKLGGTTNVNFSINAVDAAGVEDLLLNQRGNIIGMIREAANEHGEEFMEDINTGSYGGG